MFSCFWGRSWQQTDPQTATVLGCLWYRSKYKFEEDPYGWGRSHQNSRLLQAIISENLPIVEQLIRVHADDCRQKGDGRRTALHLACETGSLPIVQYLVAHGHVGVGATDAFGYTCLHTAHARVVPWLVQNTRVEVGEGDQNGNTALHNAVQFADFPKVKALVKCGKASLWCRNHNQDTPLHIAASRGHTEIFEYLLHHEEATLYSRNSDGNTPVHVACQNQKTLVVRSVLDSLSSADSPVLSAANNDGDTPLHTAVRTCDSRLVMFLTASQPENKNKLLVAQNHQGDTALHLACQQRCRDMVETLLFSRRLQHTPPSGEPCQNKNGQTPIHATASLSHDDSSHTTPGSLRHVETALIRGKNGDTPLHWFCACGWTTLLQMVLEREDVLIDQVLQVTNDHGDTLLHEAVVHKQLDVARYLISLESGAGLITAPNKKGLTPLHVSCKLDGATPVAALLIEHASMADMQKAENAPCGFTPLLAAAATGNLGTVRCLVESQKCNVYAQSCGVGTAFHCACRVGELDVARWLWSSLAADNNKRLQQQFLGPSGVLQQTPLHVVAHPWKHRKNLALRPHVFGWLCSKTPVWWGAQDKVGNTVLHDVCGNGELQLLQCLETAQSQPPETMAARCLARLLPIANHNGDTALHLACVNGHNLVVRWLLERCRAVLDMSRKNNRGNTVLHLASKQGHSQVVGLLLEHSNARRWLDSPNDLGDTALHFAAAQPLRWRRSREAWTPCSGCWPMVGPCLSSCQISSKTQCCKRPETAWDWLLHVSSVHAFH